MVLYIFHIFVTFFSLPFSELSLMGLALHLVDYNHYPSVLRHFWLGHLTRKVVPEMLSGVLNAIPVPYGLRNDMRSDVYAQMAGL